MSKSSDRKWAEKDRRAAEARNDAEIPGGPNPAGGRRFSRKAYAARGARLGGSSLQNAIKGERTELEKNKGTVGAAVHLGKQAHLQSATVAAREAGAGGTFLPNEPTHKSAGEAHLAAAVQYQRAAGHEATGMLGSEADRATYAKRASMHMRAAEEHASMAGGTWDEDKHPRDANGKFT